jgi:hypothetical protein
VNLDVLTLSVNNIDWEKHRNVNAMFCDKEQGKEQA